MTTKPRLVLAGPNEGLLTRQAYPAFAACGFEVFAVVDTPGKLVDICATGLVDLAVVSADIVPDVTSAVVLFKSLSGLPTALILPPMWSGEKERFGRELDLLAGFDAAEPWPNIARNIAQRLTPSPDASPAPEPLPASAPPLPPAVEEPSEREPTLAELMAQDLPRFQEPQGEDPPPEPVSVPVAAPGLELQTVQPAPLPTSRQRPTLRLGFWGERGGVGVSTAALPAARALAGEGQQVALFDVRQRGDLHLMVGIEPAGPPVAREGITFFLDTPTDENTLGFDAVVVDGGRNEQRFDARWVSMSRPLSQERVRKLVGLQSKPEPETSGVDHDDGDPDGQDKPRRWKGLGSIIEIEVTD